MQSRFRAIPLETVVALAGILLLSLSYVLSAFSMFTPDIVRMVGLAIVAVLLSLLFLNRHTVTVSRTVGVLVIFSTLAFIQGFISVPTTTDAHNYHIPRALYWLQNHTLFQTDIHTSHDFMGPMPSILLAFFYSLTNSDLLLFLPQWISYVLIFFFIGRIAKLLAYTSRQTQLAQILSLSIPIATLQASSVQSDLLVAIWVLVSIIFALRYVIDRNPVLLFLCTVSVVLGYLTKATMVIYAVMPIGIVGSHFFVYSSDRLKMLKAAAIGGLFGLLLCLPLLSQNKRLFNSYLGTSYTIDGESIPFMVDTLSVAGAVENIYRNLLMHVPFFSFSKSLDLWVTIVEPLGVSVRLSESSWFHSTFSHLSIPIPQEDIAPAPLHLALIAMILALVGRNKAKRTGMTFVLFFLGICSFFLFCILLRWQPYHIRQHLSILFVLLTAGIGVLKPSKKTSIIIAVITVGVGFIVLISNVSRPLISYQPILSTIKSAIPSGYTPPQSVLFGRNEANYFLSRPYWRSAYLEMIIYLHDNGVKKVAFTGREGYVYPFIYTAQRYAIKVVPGNDRSTPVKVIAGIVEDQQVDKALHCIQTADANKVICVYFNP